MVHPLYGDDSNAATLKRKEVTKYLCMRIVKDIKFERQKWYIKNYNIVLKANFCVFELVRDVHFEIKVLAILRFFSS